MEKFIDTVLGTIKAVADGLSGRLDALQRRVEQLEAKPTAFDKGVWQCGEIYEAGAIVTHGGSGWICRSTHLATGREPDHQHFRLFVKHGKDARDSR